MDTTRAILITGCSSGIGLCLAKGLHQRGYRVFATARQSADVDRLSAMGLESLQLDLSDPNSIRQGLAAVLEQTQGKLYALINNGAYGQPGAVEDLTRDTLRRQFETNLFGTQELTNHALPVMRQQGEGRIIQISSVLGIVCLAYRGAYNATKYALEALSDTMRLELRDTHIQIAIIEPGPIISHFRENSYRAYQANIDPTHSAHQENYRALEHRLAGHGAKMPFTLPPEAVLRKVIHALEAKRVRPRYAVTFPTYLFATLKRLLPIRWLDRILYAISDGNNK